MPHSSPPAGDEASTSPRPRASAKGVARRQEILDRAIEVFAIKGAGGTSLRAIAERIGVSHAALLHYFGSREELLVEVLRTQEARRNAPRTNAEEDASDRNEVVETMVRAAQRNVKIPGLVSLYTSLLAGSLEEDKETSRKYFTERFARIRAELADTIRERQAAGHIRQDVNPEAMAALVIAASDGLQTQWLLEPEVNIAESLELLELILKP